jgi:type II secretory pathway pseudopilin PulG
MGVCMPTGRRQRQKIAGLKAAGFNAAGLKTAGFTYLLLLFVLAIGSAALATLAQQWLNLDQRERETELLFRGTQFVRALASYAAATPAGRPAAPSSLEELLVDQRSEPARHHLRRLYVDPFTRQADWQLLTNETGQIIGLHSRSRQTALRVVDLPLQSGADPRAVAVGDWRFEATAPSTAASGPTPSPSPPRSTRPQNT